eukprot:Skav200130  [mRNA]  locus=scaffold4172:99507:100508:+ [translate_table: standard]
MPRGLRVGRRQLGCALLVFLSGVTFSIGRGGGPRRAAPRAATGGSAGSGLDCWQLKVAHAVDVLHRDMPDLFESYSGMGGRTHDFSIYSSNIQFADERAPGMEMEGLPTYKRFLSAMRWSLRSMFEESKMEITSMSRTLINGQLSVRWRLHLWPKGLMTVALEMFSPTLKNWGLHQNHHSFEAPFILEGYSNYDFDPWTAEVTRHSVDIKNPPMFITDLLKYSTPEMQPVPLSMPYGMSAPGSSKGFQFAGVTAATRDTALRVSRQAGDSKASWPVPASCEDDFDCNDGRANFPLQCCELPLLGKFCCKPPDDPSPDSKDPSWLPLPVPSQDP